MVMRAAVVRWAPKIFADGHVRRLPLSSPGVNPTSARIKRRSVLSLELVSCRAGPMVASPRGAASLHSLSLRKEMCAFGEGVIPFRMTPPTKNKPFSSALASSRLLINRLVLAIICSTYAEDEINGEKRNHLAFRPSITPVKAAVLTRLRGT